jgi:hypothetical protein
MGDGLALWLAALASGIPKTLIGPLAGAFAGAWAAQGIAKRNADTQRRLEELRATNAAIAAGSSIANVCAALKRQYIRPLKAQYDKLAAELEEVRAGVSRRNFEFQADLQTLLPVHTALPMLEKLLYDRISATAGAMGLFTLLAQSHLNLQSALDERNAIILGIRTGPPKTPNELAQAYFGIPNEKGHRDTRYADCVRAIALYTDDCIHFSYYLTKELVQHARKLRAPVRKGFPPATQPNFGELENSGMLPVLGEDEMKVLRSLQIELTPSPANTAHTLSPFPRRPKAPR